MQATCAEGVASASALFAYEGIGKEIVSVLKFRDGRRLVGLFAAAIAAKYRGAATLVTWAPTTPARAQARGFDQAELLARGVARRLHVPARATLRRAPGESQTGRSAAARKAHPPSFTARRSLTGHVLVIDDVSTTGATLGAAARALRSAGAARVDSAVVAQTPAPHAKSLARSGGSDHR